MRCNAGALWIREIRPAANQAMFNLKVQNLQATVVQQQKQIETLIAQLKEQAAQIQKVSAQLEMSEPAAKLVLNDHETRSVAASCQKSRG